MKKKPKVHDLKVDHKHWQSYLDGSRTATIRVNDRGFEVGDYLHLRELKSINDEGSCPVVKKVITHILFAHECSFLPRNYCLLSFKDLVADHVEIDRKAEELYEFMTNLYSPSSKRERIVGVWSRANSNTKSRYRKLARKVMIIPIEQEVVTLETAKKMKELGCRQDSKFCWVECTRTKSFELMAGGKAAFLPQAWDYDGRIAAYTTFEVFNFLPEGIALLKDHGWKCSAHISGVSYQINNKVPYHGFRSENPAEAAALCLVSLVERDFIKMNKERTGMKDHKCTICGKNSVDAENGYDTCQECLDKQ